MSVRSIVPTIAGGQFLRRRGVREIALIGALYVFYCLTRTFAENDLAPAQDRAGDLLHLERVLHLDWEYSHQPLVRRPQLGGGAGLLLVRRGPLRGDPGRAGLAVPQGRRPLLTGPLGPGGLVPDRAGLLPPAPDRSAAAARRRLRRHPQPALRRRLVGRRRLGPQGHGPAHQRAGRVPEPARRLGAVGGARRTP